MGWMFDNVGRLPAERYEPFTPGDSTALRDTLRPRDVLLVEGNNQSANSAFRFEFMSGTFHETFARFRMSLAWVVSVIARPVMQ
jgi:hypothetical protein